MSNESEDQNKKTIYEIPKVEDEKEHSTLKRVLTLIAIVLIIALASYGIVKLVPKAVSSLSSISVSLSSVFKPAEKIIVTASPLPLQSGQPFTLSWTHTSKSDANGTYNLAYACANSITLKSQSDNKTIACEKLFPLGKETSINLVAISNKSASAELPLSLLFSKANETAITVKGDTVLEIKNPTIQTSVNTSTTTKSQVPKKSSSSNADLTVNLIATGVINNANQFVSGRVAQVGEKVAVRFEIANIGGKNTGVWNWGATLPIPAPQNIYNSANEISLAPGDRIEFTLGYQRTSAGQNQIVIVADPAKSVVQNDRNNDAKVVKIDAVAGGAEGAVIQTYPGYNSNRNINGPDLNVQVLAFGILDPSTGTLTPQSQVQPGQRVGVRFEVSNLGNTATGQWTFRATLSGVSASTYYSQFQPSLAPGERNTFIVGFDISQNVYGRQQYGPYSGNNYDPYNTSQNATINIVVDPYLSIAEARRDNNTSSIIIPIPYNSNYNNNYIYYGTNNYNYNNTNGYIYYNRAY